MCEYECKQQAKAALAKGQAAPYCQPTNCGTKPYAMNNVQEYFATITTAAFYVGDNGIGDLDTLDSKGEDMIYKAFNPPDSVFEGPNIDPRFGYI